MKNRVAVSRQSFLGQTVKLCQQKPPRLFFRGRQQLGVQFVVERGIARQESPIQQRQVKLRIVFFNALALFQGPPRRAHAESQVPQRP